MTIYCDDEAAEQSLYWSICHETDITAQIRLWLRVLARQSVPATLITWLHAGHVSDRRRLTSLWRHCGQSSYSPPARWKKKLNRMWLLIKSLCACANYASSVCLPACLSQRRRGLKKYGVGRDVAIFWQHCLQKKLWVLRILILPPEFFKKCGFSFSALSFIFLKEKFPTI